MDGLLKSFFEALFDFELLKPQITKSTNYKHWVSIKDFRRCVKCKTLHGQTWLLSETPDEKLPQHFNCRCKIKRMYAITAGTATVDYLDGADWYIKNNGILPEYYISYTDAKNQGWKKGENLSDFVPGKMLYNGIHNNLNGHLPSSENRVWYEADINYKSGKRNSQRILWSNDGSIFVTYDHYDTFYEII